MKQKIIETVRKSLDVLAERNGIPISVDIEIEIPRDESMGDLATTVAMRLARQLKQPPRKIAEDIAATIRDLGPQFIESVDIAGPGFINFKLRRDFLYETLKQLLGEGHAVIRTDIGMAEKIQVEFVSANPTGPLHIGHGRGAAVGNALCNILKAAGYDVQREFYINDAGLQVQLLGRSVFARYQQMLGNEVPFPEDGYQGDYIESIAGEIRERDGDIYTSCSFDECGDSFTDYAYKKMLSGITDDLKEFGVVFDTWQSEKDLHNSGKVKKALDDLEAKGLLYKKDDAAWFSSSRFEDDKDRVVIKQDGEYTYFASDIAYHKDKLDRGFESIINIWGADHHGYIPRIRSVLEAFDLPKERFRVILIQMVSLLRHGEPVQMSKRAGNFITLREVMDKVGADIAKFIFLTRRADSHLDFDLDVAREQSSENPVFYVQYAFARISSLFRQAEETGFRDPGAGVMDADFSLLKEDQELSLIKKILQYPMIFEGAALSCEPHRITFYLQELAGIFHSFYYQYRILSDDAGLSLARLGICRAVQIVLDDGLKMIGVNAPERM